MVVDQRVNVETGKSRQEGRLAAARLLTPVHVLAAALILLAGLLMLPVSVPIGPMYWDLYLYFDAANRIFSGQVPVLDFFVPVGPLGYYLFAGGVAIFPGAQPLLLVSWSLLAVTAPLIALVATEVDRRSRALAFSLLLPFLIFAVLPFNTASYYPFPGSDGFGIYNRQVTQVLFCLMAGLVFLRSQRLMVALVALSMLALFLLKITGFAAGGLLCLFAFLTGRVTFRSALTATLIFLGALGILEIGWGFVSAYVADILTLVAMNSDSLLPRMMQAASKNFGVCLPAGALFAVLVWRDRASLRTRPSAIFADGRNHRSRLAATTEFLDHSAFWLAVGVLAGLVFESQNTGSQAMIFLWPVLLAILTDAARPNISRASFVAVTVLALAAALPVVVDITERAARAYVGAVKNVPLEHENLKTLGRVTMRPDISERADELREVQIEHRAAFEALAAKGQMPSYLQFSDFEFQIGWLRTADTAIDAIRAYEAENGVRFETILLMDFANPFPWLMDREGVKHVAIGADPYRALPPATPKVVAAVSGADLALAPTCPVQPANMKLREFYAPMLDDHELVRLTPCFDAYIRKGLTAE